MNDRDERRIARRQFLKGSLYAGSGLALGLIVGCSGSSNESATSTTTTASPSGGSFPTVSSSSRSTPTKTPARNEPFVYPLSVTEAPGNAGVKELTVIFGFDNVTSQPLTIASLGLPATASLQTAEGYTYTAEPSNPVRDFGSNSDHKPILPPGFRAEFLGGEGWNSGTAKLGLLSYAFSPAVATSGYKLRIPSLPAEFDLAQIAARPYPTDLPDAKFHDIGQASFVIPQPQNNDGKGVKLTLDGLTPVTSADLIDAGSAYKLFSLAITATNQSQGYSANPLVAAFEDIFMVADDGGVYITSGKLTDTFSPAQGASYQSPAASWMPFVDFVHLNKLEHDPRYFEESHTVFDDPIGPGVVLQANIGISLPVGVKVAKLIMPNLDNAIVNLRL